MSPISKTSLVDSAREEVGEKASSNMNASRTRFVVIVEAMLTNPPPPAFLERDEVRAAWSLPTTCLLLGFCWETEVIMLVYAYCMRIKSDYSAIATRNSKSVRI